MKANGKQTKEQRVSASAAKQARDSVLESVFDDMYRKRWKVYNFNFVRGIFFGLGSALGGTVVLALVLWIASWFIDWPGVASFLDAVKK